jgi:hypothetical protein
MAISDIFIGAFFLKNCTAPSPYIEKVLYNVICTCYARTIILTLSCIVSYNLTINIYYYK